MCETINKRLKNFIDVRYGGNMAACAESIGISKQRMWKYCKSTSVPVEVIADISKLHPDLNVYYLLHGQKPMIGSDEIKRLIAEEVNKRLTRHPY
jgi:hypothetical protein